MDTYFKVVNNKWPRGIFLVANMILKLIVKDFQREGSANLERKSDENEAATSASVRELSFFTGRGAVCL